jgi:hypothetical protein
LFQNTNPVIEKKKKDEHAKAWRYAVIAQYAPDLLTYQRDLHGLTRKSTIALGFLTETWNTEAFDNATIAHASVYTNMATEIGETVRRDFIDMATKYPKNQILGPSSHTVQHLGTWSGLGELHQRYHLSHPCNPRDRYHTLRIQLDCFSRKLQKSNGNGYAALVHKSFEALKPVFR